VKKTELFALLVVPVLAMAGGITLAADNAGTHSHASHSQASAQVAGSVLPAQLRHPASAVTPLPIVVPSASPTIGATPAPTANPVTVAPAPTPKRSTPSPAPAPTLRPVATPPPAPAPTPYPTPPPVIDSGTLPSLQFTIYNDNAGAPIETYSGDSFSQTWTCPTANANCQPMVTFDVASWGNYDLKVTWTDTSVTESQNIAITSQCPGTLGPGWGPNTGQNDLGCSGTNVQTVTLTITVAWG
jgi:hypothetical protein